MNDFDINDRVNDSDGNDDNLDRTSSNDPTTYRPAESVTPPDSKNSAQDYRYGISYNAHGATQGNSTNAPARPDTRPTPSRPRSRVIAINICVILGVLVMNFFSILLGFKIALINYADTQPTENDTPKAPTITIMQINDSTNSTGASAGEKNVLSKNEVWKKVKDSAVEIKAESVISEAYGQYHRTVNASGVIVANDSSRGEYYILTNHHVVYGAQTLIVSLNNGKMHDARLIGSDSDTDLAVLCITSDVPLTCASFGVSNKLAVGDEVMTIGNPLGSLGGTATDGIISAVERVMEIDGIPMTLLQTNVAANRGNSGGGLFNMSGNLVGVMNSKFIDEDIEGISFAIPGDVAKDIMLELIAYGYVKGRPDLGLTVSEKTRTYFGSVVGSYVIVTDPQKNDDIEINDLIYSVDGKTVSTCNDIKNALRDKKIGDVVAIEISRNRTIIPLEITIVESVPSTGSVEFDPEA